jgi:hypothetical protein
MNSESPRMTIKAEIVRGAANAELPAEITDPHRYISDINAHIAQLLAAIAEMPSETPWDVVTVDRITETTKSLAPEQKQGALWLDLTNQALAYGTLAAWKWKSLAISLVRALNERELISPSLMSRSMMELSTATLLNVREAIGVFAAAASRDDVVFVEPEQFKRIEESLYKAIWGTRIGSSKLADKKPLWERSPYPDGQVEVVNVLKGFQTFARDDPATFGTAFKIYEWLCDIVHPSTQGMRVFWDSYEEVAPGHTRFRLRQGGKRDQDFVDAFVLWGAGYSAVILLNTLQRLFGSITEIHRKLPTIYKVAPGRAR